MLYPVRGYGYKVEIIEGYHWVKTANIFNGYVSKLYKYRQSFNKSDPRDLICKLLLNSLYGRFGMSPRVEEWNLAPTDPQERMDFLSLGKYENVQDIGDITLVSNVVIKNSLEEEVKDTIQISTPIALFTTAYARILMSEYKIKYQDNLYYSDTDSLILDRELPEKEVSKGLGKFKLEYTCQEGVFISPKVYALKLTDGSEVIKVKGLKESDMKVSLQDLKDLLINNKDLSNVSKYKNPKWIRDTNQANISIKDTLYSISLNENKRELVIDSNNNIIGTRPFNIEE